MKLCCALKYNVYLVGIAFSWFRSEMMNAPMLPFHTDILIYHVTG